MSKVERLVIAAIISMFALAANATAQRPTPSVNTVDVKASATEAEVGQQVKLTVIAKDQAGNVVNEQPSTYFAGPFDIAAADDNGMLSLFGPGEVVAGAIVGGKSGFTTITVKRAAIKNIEIEPVATLLAVGSVVRLMPPLARPAAIRAAMS